MKLLTHGIGTIGPEQGIGPACWPHHDLIIVTRGQITLRVGGRRLDLQAHDAVLIPPGVGFAGTSGTGGGGIWVQHFSAAAGDMPGAFARRRGPVVVPATLGNEMVGALLRRLHELRDRRTGAAMGLRLTLFRSLLLELAQAPHGRRASRPEAQQLAAALLWAEANLGLARNLRAIAERANLSESHFRNLFRKLRNQPAGAWLRERRMGEARRLLVATRLSLKEIASHLGYSDMVSFNRSFGQHHRTPPGRFRKAQTQVV